MKKSYCDICGADLYGDGFPDFFGARTYDIILKQACREECGTKMDLCRDCNDKLAYLLQNKLLLKDFTEKLSMQNRIRLLFNRRLK